MLYLTPVILIAPSRTVVCGQIYKLMLVLLTGETLSQSLSQIGVRGSAPWEILNIPGGGCLGTVWPTLFV